MFSKTRCLLVVLLIVCQLPRASHAATVLLKGQTEPILGKVVRRDDERLVLRVVADNGTSTDRTFKTEEIEEVIAAYSDERLASLTPDRPAEYHRYAEELWARKRDPEARNMAIRLYLTAAWLDRVNFARPSLLAMASLARSSDEARKFRTALYLLDPRTKLNTAASPAVSAPTANLAAQDLLRAVRLLRTGKGATARNLVEKPAVASLLESYSSLMSRTEFNAAAGQATLSPRELRQALLLELELDSLLSANPSDATSGVPWSRQLQGAGSKAVPSYALETLTEFDPRECLFRDGKWIKPR
jgi:hypothetical protein